MPRRACLYPAHAEAGSTVAELVRTARSRWAIEKSVQAAKGQCGLGENEIRGEYRGIRYTATVDVDGVLRTP